MPRLFPTCDMAMVTMSLVDFVVLLMVVMVLMDLMLFFRDVWSLITSRSAWNITVMILCVWCTMCVSVLGILSMVCSILAAIFSVR